ncbi:MAG: T9SS type A sorting domain-containing protein [Bacteroidota bacterium]
MKKLVSLVLFIFSACLLSAQNIPDFTITDMNGKEHSLHETLRSGQAVILDFFASWCSPCAYSSVELEEFYKDNGSGLGNVEIFSFAIESNDSPEVIHNLLWGGEYPTFAFEEANRDIYNYYSQELRNNTIGSIPFFLFLCPDQDDPANSTIIKADIGYQSGMFVFSYQLSLFDCAGATKVNEIDGFDGLHLFPNPASESLTVQLEANENIEGDIVIYNVMGQLVHRTPVNTFSGLTTLEIDVNTLSSGIYLLSYRTSEGAVARKFSVSH